MKKRTIWAVIALTMMAATALTGCSSDNDSQEPKLIIDPVEPPTTMELSRGEQELVNQSNVFAFNLFRKAQDEMKSQILSPISIAYALGMLNNGADGETLAQINKVLGFEKTGADSINAFCFKMLNMAPALDPLTKVMIANNIYVNKDYTLNSDFVQKANVFYNAEPETRNFNDGKTLDVINQWASDHTEQMIQKVLGEKEFNPNAVSYLLNAIYFKGAWTLKFDKDETEDEVFNHAGETKELMWRPMMHQTAVFDYGETDDYQALRLPYGNESYVMTVLLPKKNTNAVPKVLTAEEWERLNWRMGGKTVDVKLPRIETDTDIDLKSIMIALGMPDAFNEKKADFRYFCNADVYIGLMKQVAKIKLDEEGTEAAAVTVIGVDYALGPDTEEPKIINFHANHPFLYVISERKTGAIFFIGQYTGY
ncbi:MAG: serpin family protein [Prevotella sp.]|nr:serpin family protein [Prevotella sp.]